MFLSIDQGVNDQSLLSVAEVWMQGEIPATGKEGGKHRGGSDEQKQTKRED